MYSNNVESDFEDAGYRKIEDAAVIDPSDQTLAGVFNNDRNEAEWLNILIDFIRHM